MDEYPVHLSRQEKSLPSVRLVGTSSDIISANNNESVRMKFRNANWSNKDSNDGITLDTKPLAAAIIFSTETQKGAEIINKYSESFKIDSTKSHDINFKLKCSIDERPSLMTARIVPCQGMSCNIRYKSDNKSSFIDLKKQFAEHHLSQTENPNEQSIKPDHKEVNVSSEDANETMKENSKKDKRKSLLKENITKETGEDFKVMENDSKWFTTNVFTQDTDEDKIEGSLEDDINQIKLKSKNDSIVIRNQDDEGDSKYAKEEKIESKIKDETPFQDEKEISVLMDVEKEEEKIKTNAMQEGLLPLNVSIKVGFTVTVESSQLKELLKINQPLNESEDIRQNEFSEEEKNNLILIKDNEVIIEDSAIGMNMRRPSILIIPEEGTCTKKSLKEVKILDKTGKRISISAKAQFPDECTHSQIEDLNSMMYSSKPSLFSVATEVLKNLDSLKAMDTADKVMNQIGKSKLLNKDSDLLYFDDKTSDLQLEILSMDENVFFEELDEIQTMQYSTENEVKLKAEEMNGLLNDFDKDSTENYEETKSEEIDGLLNDMDKSLSKSIEITHKPSLYSVTIDMIQNKQSVRKIDIADKFKSRNESTKWTEINNETFQSMYLSMQSDKDETIDDDDNLLINIENENETEQMEIKPKPGTNDVAARHMSDESDQIISKSAQKMLSNSSNYIKGDSTDDRQINDFPKEMTRKDDKEKNELPQLILSSIFKPKTLNVADVIVSEYSTDANN